MTNEDRAALRAHQEWLGFVQPVGLVVSLPALEKAQCVITKQIVAEQQALLAIAQPKDEPRWVERFQSFATKVLGWDEEKLVPAAQKYSVLLPEYGDELRCDFAVPDPNAEGSPVLLVWNVGRDTDFDAPLSNFGWQASPEARFERLLRETTVGIGLLWNEASVRLVYAPKGESSGHLTFSVRDMSTVAGRPILAGLCALLASRRLFDLPEPQRLPAVLRDSRQYQNEVSTKLAEQVLGALHELLRGFQSAHDASEGALLGEVLRAAPNEVYGGLLTTLLRLVFILYAEDRGLISKEELYLKYYSVTGLFAKLREDHARHPDTMDQRFGAWARLIALFRLIHDGVTHGSLQLPRRYGRLFDPDAYAFLEGRVRGIARQTGERLRVPRVSDGAIFRVLEKLLLLDGDRLSYRTLDVEQIGSVYEAMMGFELRIAHELSVALRGKRKKGAAPADPLVGLETLFDKKGGERAKHLEQVADVKVSGAAANELKAAQSIDELVAALGKRISPLSPHVLPAGAMALEPTEERRRSGSHYTPRILTEPVVEKTLRPVLDALGPKPRPDQILELKVCDPAMGSGAFLVAACRTLGDELEKAWSIHGMPAIPPDEDPTLYARRLVAQRCLYGVDKNPFAVDLAKLSLWLVTLAKKHPFTFLDHALKCGDSLVGLSNEQLMGFDWSPGIQHPALAMALRPALGKAEHLRSEIQALAGSDDTPKKRVLLRAAEDTVADLRSAADAVIECFFCEAKEKDRSVRRSELDAEVSRALSGSGRWPELPEAERLRPFHWFLELPEVFSRENSGFDAFVGNPPFAGKNTLVQSTGEIYPDWLKLIHEGAHGNADLVAHFFRRCFSLLREGGTMGLIATNTIAQGDTRASGLLPIVKAGGVIYDATRRYKWPAGAAVIVSQVHIAKSPSVKLRPRLDDREVERISAFLFHTGPDENPTVLAANADLSFQGSIVLGMGFTFDDSNLEASPLAEMARLIAKDPRNQERIFPYLGGEELNTSPTHAHHRYVINFGQMSEEEARRWPDLMAIIEEKVRPGRQRLADNQDGRRRKEYWWQWGRYTPALYEAIRGLDRVLAIARVSNSVAFAPLSPSIVFSEQLIVFAMEKMAALGILHSRPHELWARFLASSMKDDLRYTPSDCFETFPFPKDWQASQALEASGHHYHDHRAALMVANDQGLTATYNRFHDPDERDPGIFKLRELHDVNDRAALDAYGWADLRPTCTFLLDFEEEDDENEDGAKKRKKKPWRYRWPDEIRDEVLARLLALNAERAAEEQRAGDEADLEPKSVRGTANGGAAALNTASNKKKSGPRKKKAAKDTTPDLFPKPQEPEEV